MKNTVVPLPPELPKPRIEVAKLLAIVAIELRQKRTYSLSSSSEDALVKPEESLYRIVQYDLLFQKSLILNGYVIK